MQVNIFYSVLLFFLVNVSFLYSHRLAFNADEFRVGNTQCFVLDANITLNKKPWIWYAPTLPQLPNQSHTWYIEQLLERGISVAGCDQGEVRGSPISVTRFTNFYNEMVKRGYSKKPVLLGQSRGGLMMLSWAVRNPTRVSGFAGIYPVCNLNSWPMKRNLGTTLKDFGLNIEEFSKFVDQHNPINHLAGLAKAQTPLFIVHGDSDVIVPLEENSGVVAERYHELGGEAKVKIAPGKGHQGGDDFFKSTELLEFMINCSLDQKILP